VESSSAPAPPTLDDIIDRAASRYGVDQELIRAVIRTESGFDPDAISPVGAQGLMQLMPETAKELGVSDPLDAEQNVMGGTRYLRQLLDRYDGDLDRALAAYNWGMGNVERRGMEQMPQETRNYLAKVKKAGNLA
jgi:soluble lytic murein transglycosylase-like protein